MGPTPDPRDEGHSPPRRADARRNVEAILATARERLVADPDATLADIAQAAGVGRITLYGHFRTRAELIDAVLARVVAESDAALDATDTGGDPAQAMARLAGASWRIVSQFRALLTAAQRELPMEAIRAHHDRHLKRVSAVIARGQRSGAFRTDLPRPWLVTVCYSLMHAAADDVTDGRLDAADAARIVTATILGALAPPGADAPSTSTLASG